MNKFSNLLTFISFNFNNNNKTAFISTSTRSFANMARQEVKINKAVKTKKLHQVEVEIKTVLLLSNAGILPYSQILQIWIL